MSSYAAIRKCQEARDAFVQLHPNHVFANGVCICSSDHGICDRIWEWPADPRYVVCETHGKCHACTTDCTRGTGDGICAVTHFPRSSGLKDAQIMTVPILSDQDVWRLFQESTGHELVQVGGQCRLRRTYDSMVCESFMAIQPRITSSIDECTDFWRSPTGNCYVCRRHNVIHRCPDANGCCEHMGGGVTICPVSRRTDVPAVFVPPSRSKSRAIRARRVQLPGINFLTACVEAALQGEQPARIQAWANCIWDYMTTLDPQQTIFKTAHLMLAFAVNMLAICSGPTPLINNNGQLVLPAGCPIPHLQTSGIRVQFGNTVKSLTAEFTRPRSGTKAHRHLYTACNDISDEKVRELRARHFGVL